MTTSFPEDSVRCEVGDHLLQRWRGAWHAFLVEDVVSLTRLVVLKRGAEPVALVVEMPDSVDPAYNGAHLLLTAYERRFDDRDDALRAIAGGTLGDGIDRVCRALAELPAATTEVIRDAAAQRPA
jgi:hypothetical protein